MPGISSNKKQRANCNSRQQRQLLAVHQAALGFYENRQYDKATNYFTAAFCRVSNILRNGEDISGSGLDKACAGVDMDTSATLSEPTFVTIGRSSPIFSPSPHAQHQPHQQAGIGSGTKRRSPESDGTIAALFPHALQLPQPELSLDQYAFCSMYNLALSTHMATLHFTRSRRQLEKTARLWEMLYNMLDRGRHDLDYRHRRDCLNLRSEHIMGVLSNLGHAQKLLGRKASSLNCYRNMLATLEFMKGRNQPIPFVQLFSYLAYWALIQDENNPAMIAQAA